MKKIHFSFNKDAREVAIHALDKLIALASPTSLLFNILVKEMHDKMVLTECTFGVIVICFFLKVFVSCFEDVNSKTEPKDKSPNDTS